MKWTLLTVELGLAVRPIFGPDSDSYKNPPKNETDKSVDSKFLFFWRISDSSNILKGPIKNEIKGLNFIGYWEESKAAFFLYIFTVAFLLDRTAAKMTLFKFKIYIRTKKTQDVILA